MEIGTTTSTATSPTGTASKPFYLYIVNSLDGTREYLRLNSIGYLVALTAPTPINVDTYAGIFSILADGRLFNYNGSTVAPAAAFAKVPPEQGPPVNTSSAYLYLRFGADASRFTETAFFNNSGILDWVNVKFDNIITPGHAIFGFNPSATTHVGWIDVVFYGTDTLPGTSAQANVYIQDFDSIPPPTFSLKVSSSSSMTSTPQTVAMSTIASGTTSQPISQSISDTAMTSSAYSNSSSATPTQSASDQTMTSSAQSISSSDIASQSSNPAITSSVPSTSSSSGLQSTLSPTSTSPMPSASTCASLSLPSSYFAAPPAGATCVSYAVSYNNGIPTIVSNTPVPSSSMFIPEG